MPTAVPAYLKIVADLRQQIVTGELGPGAKLPSESELRRIYGVSETVTRRAIAVLKSEGLVEGRHGAGVFVRIVRRLMRYSHGHDMRTPGVSGSLFARDAAATGHAGTWEHESRHESADDETARRLAIEPGGPVMRTRYRFLADGRPIQLSDSREPLAITAGTSVEWPEDGAAVGVVARFDLIPGVRIDVYEEQVTARSATPEEIERLDLPIRGATVLQVERTYYAAGVPVETADIVFPSDRYVLVYRMPID